MPEGGCGFFADVYFFFYFGFEEYSDFAGIGLEPIDGLNGGDVLAIDSEELLSCQFTFQFADVFIQYELSSAGIAKEGDFVFGEDVGDFVE